MEMLLFWFVFGDAIVRVAKKKKRNQSEEERKKRKKKKKKEKKMKEPVRWREKVKKKKTKSHVWAQVLSWMSDRGFYKVTIFTTMLLKLSFHFP